MREKKKLIRLESYKPEYKEAFKSLNEEWIQKYFKIEEKDIQVLNNPEKYIIEPGGEIFIAFFNDEPVGACALQIRDDEEYKFELAKMAVSPKVQGKGIGYLLGNAVVEKAKELGASNVYIETNSRLLPAISLYSKLGFLRIPLRNSPYERSNVQLELRF